MTRTSLFRAAFLLLFLTSGHCRSHSEVIRDLLVFPQDLTHYLKPGMAHRELVSHSTQLEMNGKYQSRFFSPWHQELPACTGVTLALTFIQHRSNPGYGENRKKHTLQWFHEMEANAHLNDYPNGGFRGITVNHADMRVLPTQKPHFTEMDDNGSGYPFDNFQKSSLAANTPVWVAHLTCDKAWLFVDSHYASGWVPARDVARVDEAFVRKWEESEFIAPIQDDLPVIDSEGHFLFKASIGAQFPLLGEDQGGYHVLVADTNSDRRAVFKQAWLTNSSAVRKPMRITRANVAAIADELIGKPYGWGGLHQNRDCSAMLKDLFAPFGIWLPRHSSNQAMEGGRFVPLKMHSPGEKIQVIRREGIPFFTLLWAKGHIMLYVGEHKGELAVFHNMWSVKTRDILGREASRVVGQAAVTSLHPGAELAGVSKRIPDILSRIEGMTLLIHAPQ